jgi:cytochrome c6
MPPLARMRPRSARFLLAGVAAVSPLAASAASAQDAADAELGKRVFTAEAEPPCGLCHALADAGATGKIGPSLDQLKPTEQRVRAAVSDGVGAMPAYETLSEEEIAAVARYVATATGQAR